MAEGKVRNLLRLSSLRDKYDALTLAIHACLVEKGFRCIGCGEEVCKLIEKLLSRERSLLTQMMHVVFRLEK